MMLNWPFMWKPANDPETSKIAGKVGAAINAAGPAGTASIDGTDAYTITKLSPNPEEARKLIEFYLDPEVQEKSPNAKVVLDQANAPYDSFVTPDYNEVTQAIGTEIQKALKKEVSAADAIKSASDLVAAIVKNRG
jgi:multiple sugar transport system substrate-binding protein